MSDSPSRRSVLTALGAISTTLPVIRWIAKVSWNAADAGGNVDFILKTFPWFWSQLDKPVVMASMFATGVILLVWAWKTGNKATGFDETTKRQIELHERENLHLKTELEKTRGHLERSQEYVRNKEKQAAELQKIKDECLPATEPSLSGLAALVTPRRFSHKEQIDGLSKEVSELKEKSEKEREEQIRKEVALEVALDRFKQTLALERIFHLGCNPPISRNLVLTIRYFDLKDSELADKVANIFRNYRDTPWTVNVERRGDDHVRPLDSSQTRLWVKSSDVNLSSGIQSIIVEGQFLQEDLSVSNVDVPAEGTLIAIYPRKDS